MTGPLTVQITLDCAQPHALADWWAETLGWEVEPSDEEFIARMVAAGHATEAETTRHRGVLVWATGAAIRVPTAGEGSRGDRMLFQLVPEPKTVKNRMHLDVRLEPGASLVDARAALEARGARFLHEASQGPHRWFTMADPEGNEFCIS